MLKSGSKDKALLAISINFGKGIQSGVVLAGFQMPDNTAVML